MRVMKIKENKKRSYLMLKKSLVHSVTRKNNIQQKFPQKRMVLENQQRQTVHTPVI